MTLVLDSLTVNGGAFDIDVDGDGIQADTALTINNGTIDIQTWKGYSTWDDTLAEAYSCKGGTWSHNWDNGSTADGVTTYTCSTCSATETQTVAESASVDACSHTALHDSEETDATEETDEGFTATFAGDAGVASIDVYYTSDYTSVSENVYEKKHRQEGEQGHARQGENHAAESHDDQSCQEAHAQDAPQGYMGVV